MKNLIRVAEFVPVPVFLLDIAAMLSPRIDECKKKLRENNKRIFELKN